MIIKSPTITLDFTGASPVDVSDYVISAQLDGAQSIVDDRTFGEPHASDAVSAAHSVTLTLRWSDAMMAVFDTYSETEVDMVLTAVATGGNIAGTVKWAYQPLPGDVAIGEKVTAELPMAVVDELDWSAAA